MWGGGGGGGEDNGQGPQERGRGECKRGSGGGGVRKNLTNLLLDFLTVVYFHAEHICMHVIYGCRCAELLRVDKYLSY